MSQARTDVLIQAPVYRARKGGCVTPRGQGCPTHSMPGRHQTSQQSLLSNMSSRTFIVCVSELSRGGCFNTNPPAAHNPLQNFIWKVVVSRSGCNLGENVEIPFLQQPLLCWDMSQTMGAELWRRRMPTTFSACCGHIFTCLPTPRVEQQWEASALIAQVLL